MPNSPIDIFTEDIKRGSFVTPIVSFGQFDPYFFSSQSGNISITGNANEHTIYPNLIQVPKIKESIDVESRKYKISNVSISLSNDRIQGKKLSNFIHNHESFRVNSLVVILFKTSSMKNVLSCLEIYKGRIREILHKGNNISIEVEDSSQEDIHRELPQTRTSPDDEQLIANQRNKLIPMVYGEVKKSPCITEVYQDNSLIIQSGLLFDSQPLNIDSEYMLNNISTVGSAGQEIVNSHIYIGGGDSYLPIGKTDNYDGTGKEIFQEDDSPNSVKFKLDTTTVTGILGTSELVGHYIRKPESSVPDRVVSIPSDESWTLDNLGHWQTLGYTIIEDGSEAVSYETHNTDIILDSNPQDLNGFYYGAFTFRATSSSINSDMATGTAMFIRHSFLQIDSTLSSNIHAKTF